jgi:hypothetical protein
VLKEQPPALQEETRERVGRLLISLDLEPHLADRQRRRQGLDAIVQAMKARAAADDLDIPFDPAGW